MCVQEFIIRPTRTERFDENKLDTIVNYLLIRSGIPENIPSVHSSASSIVAIHSKCPPCAFKNSHFSIDHSLSEHQSSILHTLLNNTKETWKFTFFKLLFKDLFHILSYKYFMIWPLQLQKITTLRHRKLERSWQSSK